MVFNIISLEDYSYPENRIPRILIHPNTFVNKKIDEKYNEFTK